MADEHEQEPHQPMTAAELAAVRERHEKATRGYWHEGNRTATLRAHDYEGTMTVVTVLAESLADVQALTHAWQDITALLADATYWRGKIEQAAERMRELEAENERLREIARAVARLADNGGAPDYESACTQLYDLAQHARAILATVQAEAEA